MAWCTSWGNNGHIVASFTALELNKLKLIDKVSM